jgi:hypothetical protein
MRIVTRDPLQMGKGSIAITPGQLELGEPQ